MVFMVEQLSPSSFLEEYGINQEIFEIFDVIVQNNPNITYLNIIQLISDELNDMIIEKIQKLHPKILTKSQIKTLTYRLKRSSPNKKEIINKQIEKSRDQTILEKLKDELNEGQKIEISNEDNDGNDNRDWIIDGFGSNASLKSFKTIAELSDNSFLRDNPNLNEIRDGTLHKEKNWNNFSYSSINLCEIQESMKKLGVISKDLTLSQIDCIINNPFIKFAKKIKKIPLKDEEHEDYKRIHKLDSETL